MKLYVRMTDKFMSGWGKAEGKTNVLVIECENWTQAIAISAAAKERREMRRVKICGNAPRDRVGVLHSRKHFTEFSGPWLAYYRTDNAA